MKRNMSEGEKMAKRNQYWDKATEFRKMAQCFERGTSDRARFEAEAQRMERLADKVAA